MQAIFKALRALRKCSATFGLPEGQMLRPALHLFESSNRGHQHELDELGLAAGQPSYNAAAVKFGTRFWTFRDTTRSLMGALARTPKAALPDEQGLLDEVPRAFAEFWTAKDATDCLEHFAVEDMRVFINCSAPRQFALDRLSISYADGGIRLALTLQHARHKGLLAARTAFIPCETLDSMAGCMRGLQLFRRTASELLKNPESWPEFTSDRQGSALDSECRNRLADFMAGCKPEQREWFAKNWAQFTPVSLPPGRYA